MTTLELVQSYREVFAREQELLGKMNRLVRAFADNLLDVRNEFRTKGYDDTDLDDYRTGYYVGFRLDEACEILTVEYREPWTEGDTFYEKAPLSYLYDPAWAQKEREKGEAKLREIQERKAARALREAQAREEADRQTYLRLKSKYEVTGQG